MKAIVNIALRSVRLTYSVKEIVVAHSEWGKHFIDYEITKKDSKSKNICNHTINFDSIDEWQSVLLFDGRTIDFHYDYEAREGFDSKKDWANYLFQGYESRENQDQDQVYHFNEIKKATITF